MERRFRKRNKPSGVGGFLVATLVVTCLFLMLNVPFVRFLHIWSVQYWNQLAHPKAAQLTMLIGPLVLLMLEWCVVDTLVNRLSGESRSR
ncbi:MAG TPA: hypothetical protein EYG57_05810 [Planctomycetes bacterium]|nr:hypothetical protein [Planctomycetota bacterium]